MLKKIADIKKALEAKAYLSALSLALTLPDICGKIAHPELKKNSERYIAWFDEYITANSFNEIRDYPLFDGKKCYKLRCSFLHEGSIDGVPDVDEFKLSINGLSSFGITTTSFGKYKDIPCHSIRLDVNQVCFWIYRSAEAFYNNHDDKSIFNDQNIILRDIEAEANEIRKINNPPSFEEEDNNFMKDMFPEPE